MHEETFFQVPRTRRKCSVGSFQLPIFYYDASNVMVFVPARREGVEQLLEGTGLEPALMVGNQAVVGISTYEYRDSDADAYNEVGVALPVFRAGHGRPLAGLAELFRAADERELGFHIVDLPVTTEIANAAGREFWSFPKFVTDIDFEWQGSRFRCEVKQPDTGEPIMTLEGRSPALMPLPSLDLVLYSVHRSKLLRTRVDVRSSMHMRLPGSLRLSLGAGQHPMKERLETLGVDGARALAVFSTDRFQSRLNSGVPVGSPEEPAVSAAT